MAFSGALVPQANNLSVLVECLHRVLAGHTTDSALIPPGYDRRQGRYYRLASQDLGLLRLAGPNQAELTQLGTRLLEGSREDRVVMLRHLIVRQNPFLALVVQRLEEAHDGWSMRDLTQFIAQETELTGSTPGRRASTVKRWLIDTGLAYEENGRLYRSQASLTIDAAETPPEDHILSGAQDLLEADVPEVPRELPPNVVARMVDTARTERANAAHEALRLRVANNASRAGYRVRPGGYIDICVVKPGRVVIFEVKSATETNYISQVRAAVAQLYEYRYVQRLPDAELCLAIETPPSPEHSWIVDYLIRDRGIYLLYMEDGLLTEPDGQAEQMSDFTG